MLFRRIKRKIARAASGRAQENRLSIDADGLEHGCRTPFLLEGAYPCNIMVNHDFSLGSTMIGGIPF
jgi:hypothetical protein